MKKYRYKAKDNQANLVTGIVEANNPQHAAKLIRQKNLVVITITPIQDVSFDLIKKFQDRITSSDIANFTRQLSTMINAGLQLTEALVILRSQSKVAMQKIVSTILADVEEGEPLSTAMGKHPNAFSKTFVALIKSGEMGGVMDEVLAKLSDDLEKQEEFKGKVKGALIYPIIIFVGMIAVGIVMLIVVVPKMTQLYDQFGAELPMATKFLISASDIMIKFWPILAALAFGAFSLFKMYRKTKDGRRKTDELLFKIPIIGDLQRQIVLTDLTRTLALMTSSGVSILEGLVIATEVVNNRVISDALDDTAKKVEKGFPLAFAFSRHPEAFPFLLSQMVAVGEETGKMDEVMKKISHVFEIESEQKVKALTAAIEPIILIVLGIGVSFLVIAVIMPIYNLTTNMSI
jgi:type IV pilus assembly protein PilC